MSRGVGTRMFMCLSSKGGREEVNIIYATTVKVEIFTIGWLTFAFYSDRHHRQLLSSSKSAKMADQSPTLR